MTRHEQRATVLVGHYGSLVGTQLAGEIDYLLFIGPHQWAEHRHFNGVAYHGHVVQRLRTDLSAAFAGYNRLGLATVGQLFGNPHHKPPVQDYPIGRRCGQNDLLLNFTQRRQVQDRAVLVTGKKLGQVHGLFNRGHVHQRVAVEVDKLHPAAALHQLPRRHRGIDPSRKHGRHQAADTYRQTAVALYLVKINQYFLGQHVQVNLEVRAGQINPGPRHVFNVLAYVAANLVRGNRKPLVRPVCGDSKRLELASLQQSGQRIPHQIEVRPHRIALEVLGYAHTVPYPLPHHRPSILVGESKADDHLPLPHPLDARAFGGRPQVLHQPAHEPRAVLTLKGQFVGLDYYVKFHATKLF